MQQEMKFWQGTNFWIAIVLAFGGLVVGFPEGDARQLIGGIFATIASAGLLREKLKNVQIDFRAWIRSVNTWNYIAAAATAIVPALPLDLFARLRDLADAILGGNWQGIATALFSIGTMLYYIFRPKTISSTVKTAKS